MKKEHTEIVRILAELYPNTKAPLRHRSVFELLIAVILSAQCTDARVNTITPLLFPKNRACEPTDILELGENKVRAIIRPCGYFNQKTKAIMGVAKAMAKSGKVPSDFESLRKLPGVGPKTAQVIQSQWFNIPAFPVDTHIHRILNRLGIANSGKNRDKTERQAKASIDEKYWIDLHLQLIYFGRSICIARKPKCGECPLFKQCKWPDKKKFALKRLAPLKNPPSKID
jgi:endonuclease-3